MTNNNVKGKPGKVKWQKKKKKVKKGRKECHLLESCLQIAAKHRKFRVQIEKRSFQPMLCLSSAVEVDSEFEGKGLERFINSRRCIAIGKEKKNERGISKESGESMYQR